MIAAESRVLLIEDDTDVRLSMQQTLELNNIEVTAFASAVPALAELSSDWPGVILSDVRMPGIDGLKLLGRARNIDADLPVILITGHGDIAMAVDAMRAGAYDFIEKPCPSGVLIDVIQRALEKRALVLENRALRRQLDTPRGLESVLIGKSARMARLRNTLQSLLDIDVDILIIGETGTGKELVSRCLHEFGPRADRPLVALNCGGLPESIIESELFGHEAGAFTHAVKRRIGKLEYANGGILLLDEIESMPMALQVRLLRVLQERSLERLGSNQTIPLDIRVLAASKVDLRQEVAVGRFRQDLLYRLNVVSLPIPALRDRPDDIPLLFHHFLVQACARFGRKLPLVPTERIETLMAHDWPGNVRELQNAADRFALELDSSTEPTPQILSPAPMTLAERIEAYEKTLIERELIAQQGNITATYTALGLGRKTLYEKMRRHRLQTPDYRPS